MFDVQFLKQTRVDFSIGCASPDQFVGSGIDEIQN
jgi:hypothetical protein